MSKRAVHKRGLVEAVVTQLRLAKYLTLYTVAYLIILGAGVWVVFQLQEQDRRLQREHEERVAFDNRREYDICVAGNERIEVIKDAFVRQARDSAATLIRAARRSQEDEPPMSPSERQKFDREAAAYIADAEKTAKNSLVGLEPRDCRTLLNP